MLKDEYKIYEEKMKKSIESVVNDFDTVRAGRANASVLNRISVDYYGTPTPIQQIGSIGSPDPRTLVITPWDASALKGIEKAIQESDLGINPQNDGKCIRLAFPQLTEERRKELVKQIHKYTEAGKVAVRNIRRDALENFKKQQKASEITEDEMKIVEKDLQKLTDDSCKELDKLLENKEKELMSVYWHCSAEARPRRRGRWTKTAFPAISLLLWTATVVGQSSVRCRALPAIRRGRRYSGISPLTARSWGWSI